ncbi:MAG TPA: SDR family oxidoreductase [Sphingobacteriaceae bacterium]
MKDQVIWITGASSGIGEALARRISGTGAKLILSARDRDELFRVKELCGGNPMNIHVHPLDLEDTASLPAKAAEAERMFGRIDLIIHSGGVSQRSLALETRLEVAQKIMNINFWGTVALTQAVLPGMLARKKGHVVVVSSLVGKFGTRLRSAYSASKHALHGYFESLRCEISEPEVRITLVCPGFIRTRLSFNALTADGKRQDRMDDAQEHGMSPEECAEKILEAIRNGSEEVLIGGKETYAVLFKRFFPGLFSRKIRKAKVT